MKKATGAVCNWLKSTDTPRWWLVLMLLAGALVTTGGSYLMDGYKRAEDLRSAQVLALIDSMTQFYVQAVAFSSEVQQTKHVPIDARNALTRNLGEQFARLNLVEPYIPVEQKQILERYRQSILKMQGTLQAVEGPEQLGPFFADASRLLVARNRLNAVLLTLNGGRPT